VLKSARATILSRIVASHGDLIGVCIVSLDLFDSVPTCSLSAGQMLWLFRYTFPKICVEESVQLWIDAIELRPPNEPSSDDVLCPEHRTTLVFAHIFRSEPRERWRLPALCHQQTVAVGIRDFSRHITRARFESLVSQDAEEASKQAFLIVRYHQRARSALCLAPKEEATQRRPAPSIHVQTYEFL
jgi:hypothetical protein